MATPDGDLSDFVRCMWERELSIYTVRVRRDTLLRLSMYLGKPLREATHDDLLRWRAFAVKGRARETEKVYVASVRAFYAWSTATGRTAVNPAARLRPRSPTELAAEARAQREAEMVQVEKFLRASMGSPGGAACAARRAGRPSGPTVNDLGLLNRR